MNRWYTVKGKSEGRAEYVNCILAHSPKSAVAQLYEFVEMHRGKEFADTMTARLCVICNGHR